MDSLQEMHLTCNKLNGTIPKGFDTLPFIIKLTVNCNEDINCSISLTRSNFLFACGNINCGDCRVYIPIIVCSP